MTDKTPAPSWAVHAALALILVFFTGLGALALYALWTWITQ